MAEHSPTPWKTEIWLDGPIQVVDADSHPVVGVNYDFGGTPSAIICDPRDLAHIVHCVNLHDELVAVLKHLRYEAKYSRSDGEWVTEVLKKAGALP